MEAVICQYKNGKGRQEDKDLSWIDVIFTLYEIFHINFVTGSRSRLWTRTSGTERTWTIINHNTSRMAYGIAGACYVDMFYYWEFISSIFCRTMCSSVLYGDPGQKYAVVMIAVLNCLADEGRTAQDQSKAQFKLLAVKEHMDPYGPLRLSEYVQYNSSRTHCSDNCFTGTQNCSLLRYSAIASRNMSWKVPDLISEGVSFITSLWFTGIHFYFSCQGNVRFFMTSFKIKDNCLQSIWLMWQMLNNFAPRTGNVYPGALFLCITLQITQIEKRDSAMLQSMILIPAFK